MDDNFQGVESLVAVINAAVVLDRLDGRVAGGLLRDFCYTMGEDLEQYRGRLHPRIRVSRYWADVALERAKPREQGRDVLARLLRMYVGAGLVGEKQGTQLGVMFGCRVGPSYISEGEDGDTCN